MPFIKKIASFLLVVCTLAGVTGCNSGRYVQIRGYAQGGEYSVKMNLSGVHRAPVDIMADIDSILNDIDFTLSGYNKGSLLSRLNAGETVVLNEMFCDLYAISYGFWQQSGGAFDIAAGPLFDIWGFGFTNDSLPNPEDVSAVLASCGMGRLKTPSEVRDLLGVGITSSDLLSIDEGHLNLALPRLNFNAIAQGYSCDLVAAYLHSIGCTEGMLVDIGEIYCEGLNPNGKPWNIGIDNPADGNNNPGKDLRGIWTSRGRACGVVTSGNYRKFYIRDGRKYSHTIDPRTGYPVGHSLLSATIVASDATTADALATYCMVIGPEEARTFIQARHDLEGYLISSEGIWKSEEF